MDPTLDTAPCGYLRLSKDGSILGVNATLSQWVGLSKLEIEGKPIYTLLPKSSQIFFQAQVLTQIELSGELEECHFRLAGKGGDRIPVLGNFRQRRQEGEPVYDVIVMRIQKRHQLEDTLVRAKRETDVYVDKLQKSNEALGRFASMVAHDLKAPIRNMKNLCKFISEDFTGVLDDSGRDLLRKLEKNAERATHFIDKLFEYGSLAATEALPQAVDLNEIVQAVLEDLKGSIEKTSATVEVSNLPVVLGFEIQLMQLFQNIIGNAIKYRSPARAPIVELQATKATETHWEISVKDNGLGIPAKYQAEIFGITFRLHGADYEGAGIGLATCEWIVRNHRGVIGVDSALGEGSRFYFTLVAADG
jgi:PAS domain S-box-containing protein